MAKRILILGGGYSELLSALTARKYITAEETTIIVVNRVPSHQIITELHRLAVGNLSEQNVALPLERLLRGKDINLVVDTVEKTGLDSQRVTLGSGESIKYDALVVALGSETAFFGIPGLQEYSFTLKSVEEANRLRTYLEERIVASKESKNKADTTFVVGGGGLSGIELVGEFADMLPGLCHKHGVDFTDVSMYCVEAAPSILAGFAPELVERAKTSLEKRGVTILTGVPVTELKETTVFLKDGNTIETKTMVWTG